MKTTPLRDRAQDPARCEVFFRNLAGMGVIFDIDLAAGRVAACYAGGAVDLVLQDEVDRRAWWLLEQEGGGHANAHMAA